MAFYRFLDFELDSSRYELRRQGRKLRLEKIPMDLLIMLVEKKGDLVPREAIIDRIWGKDVYFDSEAGINTAIRKIRQTLNDDPENPRFVETVPRRGYRMVVEIEDLGAAQGGVGVEEAGQAKSSAEASRQMTGLKRRLFSPLNIAIAAGVLTVMAAGAWWLTRPAAGPYTIAVLPLKNLSPEPGTDYFSDGLTDEIIRNLSIIDGLEVKSRTSSFAFKDKPRDIHEVGAQLNTNLVVEGSVLRAGDKLRIDAQLVRVSDDSVLWSNRYDRELRDVFAIQDEISRSIVNELRLKLGGGQRRYNTNLEAYDLYLRAQSLTYDARPGHNREQLVQGIEMLEQVVAKDPGFAPAYAGIATSYADLSSTPRSISPDEIYAKMRAAAEKALQLDPLLAEAYASIGTVHSRDRAWGEAEQAFRRSIQLNPNLSKPRVEFAIDVLFPLGRLDDAVRELRKAVELDPLSIQTLDLLDFVLISLRRYDEVLDNCRRILTDQPDDGFAQQL